MNDNLTSTASLVHGDPIAPVILGVTAVLLLAIIDVVADGGRMRNVTDDATFTAIVVMVVFTTLMLPPLLKVSIARQERRQGRA